MALVRSVRGVQPQLGAGVFLAENATVIGDVHIGPQASIWYQCVLRGDVHRIEIGARSNVQDGTVIHATYQTHATFIDEDVTVGHLCLLHGCHIEKRCLIGMGSIIMDGARIGENSIVGAGTLIPEGKVYPPGSLILGRPGVVKRSLTESELAFLGQSIDNYLLYKSWYEE